MSLSNGRQYLAVPGPSVLPDRVLQAMTRPSPNIFEGELVDTFPEILQGLRSVARTTGDVAVYIGNGHAGWEAALANVFSRGDRVLLLATGSFGHGWGEMAQALGIEVETLDFGRRAGVDGPRLREVLAADKAHRIRGVLAVQVDTSTSIKIDVAALRTALDDTGHPALLLVDAIACLGVDPLEMDAWGVDVTVSASQKGLMTPPGLAFVFFNSRASRARERANCVTGYWDWKPRVAPDVFYQHFCGTPPAHHLFGLREALSMIAEEGLEAVWARHACLARAVWAACDAWGAGGSMALNVAEPALRSHATTTVHLGPPDGTRLRNWARDKAGLTLGLGLGMGTAEDPRADGTFRIGHMGHVNAHMIMGALGAIEAGLKGCGIAHGSGALEAAADVIAGGAG